MPTNDDQPIRAAYADPMSETPEHARLQDLLELLSARPGLTCTEIGETLWSGVRRSAPRQSYALPAGALAKAAIAAGLVREYWVDCGTLCRPHERRVFKLTAKGQKRAELARESQAGE